MSSQPSGHTEGQPSPQAQLQEMIVGFRPTQLIHVAAKLGIADLLKDASSSGPTAPLSGCRYSKPWAIWTTGRRSGWAEN